MTMPITHSLMVNDKHHNIFYAYMKFGPRHRIANATRPDILFDSNRNSF